MTTTDTNKLSIPELEKLIHAAAADEAALAKFEVIRRYSHLASALGRGLTPAEQKAAREILAIQAPGLPDFSNSPVAMKIREIDALVQPPRI